MSRLSVSSQLTTSLTRLRHTVCWPHDVNVKIVVAVTVAVGIALRLATWWSNRSLWLDEIYLALNITDRSLAELWRPLDHDQGAPIGFLMLVKSTTMFFGTSEWVLRLIPLAAGIGAVVLFPFVARQWLPAAGACFATMLFAVTPKLIYYSSELKQYSSDVFVTLVLLWLANHPRQVWQLALVGASAVWFSHPSVFVLAGIGIVLFWQGEKSARKRFILMGLAWFASFAACYVVSLRSLSKNSYLIDYWTEYFAPMPPRSFEQAGWYLRALGWLFEGPAGMTLADISFAIPAVMLFTAGIIWALRDRPKLAVLILLPLAFTLLASILHRYPFGGRLLLFALPLLCLGMGAGWEALRPGWRDGSAWVCLGLCVAVFIAPAGTAMQQLAQQKVAEDHRAAIGFLAKNWQSGDGVYLSAMAREPFRYYGRALGIPVESAILGQPKRDDWDNVKAGIHSLQGRPRVWVFVAHERGANHQFTTWQLDQQGAQLKAKSFPGAAVYLYDLSVAR